MTRVPSSLEAGWEAVAIWRSSCCHSVAPLDSSFWNAFTATHTYFLYTEVEPGDRTGVCVNILLGRGVHKAQKDSGS